jgi:hypothetical protein
VKEVSEMTNSYQIDHELVGIPEADVVINRSNSSYVVCPVCSVHLPVVVDSMGYKRVSSAQPAYQYHYQTTHMDYHTDVYSGGRKRYLVYCHPRGEYSAYYSSDISFGFICADDTVQALSRARMSVNRAWTVDSVKLLRD